MSSWQPRPIEEWEQPLLEALGRRLAELRALAGVSQEQLAWRAELGKVTVWRIEKARMRTRRITLGRLMVVLVEALPELGDPDVLADELAALAGAALAPPSPYQARIEKRRARRSRRRVEEAERMRAYVLRKRGLSG